MGIVVKKLVVKKASSGVAKVKTHTRKRKNGVSVIKQHTKKVVKARGTEGKFSKPPVTKSTSSKTIVPSKSNKSVTKKVTTKAQ